MEQELQSLITNSEKILIRAGQMDFDTDSQVVSAQKESGRLEAYISEEDNLVHLDWINKKSGEKEDELICIQGMTRLEISKQRDRVLIVYTDEEPVQFYWFQSPKKENDQIFVDKLQELIDSHNID